MRNRLNIVLLAVTFAPLLKGTPLENDSNLCGDWINFKNEKCLKLLGTDGPKTQKEAENACKSLPGSKSFSTLVTIKTSKQQEFVHQMLYENDMNESVWLGLKLNNHSQQFEWNDGSDLVFSNWMKPNASVHNYQCVEMNEEGLWVEVSCTKTNTAVCEARPTWPMDTVQNEHQALNPAESERKVNQSEKDCEEKMLISEKKIDLLKEAADKTVGLFKEAEERIADLEQSEDPKQPIVYKKPITSALLTVPRQSQVCGEWTSYNDEKCVKVADQVGASQEDAESICQALGLDSDWDSLPKLITIKSIEEQEFLQQFLFVEKKLVDNVWLGLTKNVQTGLFSWNDGSKLFFSHWANQTVSDARHQCVQMESGDGLVAAGRWFKASCERNNAVLCERRPVWKLETLQNAFLSFKLEQDMKQKELQKRLLEADVEKEAKQKEWDEKFMKSEGALKALTKNSVPIGFIYIQLPDQHAPTTLWPTANWEDVSSKYEGLFFRVAGGNAAPFGQIQEEDTKRLSQVKNIGVSYANYSTVSILPDGTWSESVFTGPNSGSSHIRIQFRSSTGEIRPRNQAVRVWQRIQ